MSFQDIVNLNETKENSVIISYNQILPEHPPRRLLWPNYIVNGFLCFPLISLDAPV